MNYYTMIIIFLVHVNIIEPIKIKKQGCDHSQMSQKPCWTTKKLSILLNIFM